MLQMREEAYIMRMSNPKRINGFIEHISKAGIFINIRALASNAIIKQKQALNRLLNGLDPRLISII
jgi:hypothetical protein